MPRLEKKKNEKKDPRPLPNGNQTVDKKEDSPHQQQRRTLPLAKQKSPSPTPNGPEHLSYSYKPLTIPYCRVGVQFLASLSRRAPPTLATPAISPLSLLTNPSAISSRPRTGCGPPFSP
ncbi:Uncharacterized protein Fot_33251 [Forsythia ovata]|uniref:Uncharacterized protein n=1 Tax=Forsythia ovata TaxID=205694 RepID=A0ABD1TA88_9LAMI